jgi:hypothetical protein
LYKILLNERRKWGKYIDFYAKSGRMIVNKFVLKEVGRMKEMIVVEGFKAFRGIMSICRSGDCFTVRGVWLYRPDTDCWYCSGSSYPACICEVVEVE